LLETFLDDVRYGVRLIRRNALLSTVVVLTVTVGIGINASVFTVVNGLMIRAHVTKDPESFIRVVPTARLQRSTRPASYAEYVSWRDHTHSLRQLAAWTHFPAMVGDDDSIGSPGLAVSCNFFAVDGLDHATLGRLFVPDDCRAPGQVPVGVISEAVWHTRFASDPRVIRQVVRINNRPVILVGIVPDYSSAWTRVFWAFMKRRH
jgi:putative ABC transport system permease protein